ncbi:MAG: glycosyl transferase family 2 [Glaciihabitans sp.]|nr:glycosyl transferase family 2 [Glaciihabitans sp.]
MMPFYGRVDHFKIAVLSVLTQTDPDWRLVVLDDCYPDLSAGQWLQALGDSRIEYVRYAENVGINANFQAAIDRAVNERFVIFGCDDVMLPRYVQRVREIAAEHPDAAMIHPGTEIIDGDGKVVRTLVDSMKALYKPKVKGTLELSGENFAVSITRGNWMNFPAIAWRRDVAARIGFRPGFEVVQDLALALDVAFDGGSLFVDDEVVFRYRRHSGSVSSWQAAEGRRFVEERRFFTSVGEEFAARGWQRARRAAELHLSSRINALTRLPSALATRQRESIGTLLRHALR